MLLIHLCELLLFPVFRLLTPQNRVGYIINSLSRAGTPTHNASMEAINGWIKEELFIDFHLKDFNDPIKSINEYIYFFNLFLKLYDT